MTAPETIVVPLVPPSREEQLQAEVNELRAALERVSVGGVAGTLPPDGADLVLLGGGLVGEFDGWLWLVRGGTVRRLWRAETVEVEQANAIRGAIERGLEERRRNAS